MLSWYIFEIHKIAIDNIMVRSDLFQLLIGFGGHR